jgi:hypothetical protein
MIAGDAGTPGEELVVLIGGGTDIGGLISDSAGDGGTVNIVAGTATGQCAGLVAR